MALTIRNPHVELLATEVAKLGGESKTEAIGRAFDQHRARLVARPVGRNHREEFLAFLQRGGRLAPINQAHSTWP